MGSPEKAHIAALSLSFLFQRHGVFTASLGALEFNAQKGFMKDHGWK